MLVRFGGCEVDLDRVEIRRDDDLVPVEPQVYDVLTYLLDHRERVVTKEELLDNIWGDRFVSESALTSRIKSARQAVGDNGRDQAVIKTVHGRGYRFVADVDVFDADSAVATVGPTGRVDADNVAAGNAAPTPAASTTAHVDPVRGDPSDDRWPPVGRHDDLDRLHEYFEAGTYAGVLLTGPAGIGKTRLATECLRLAESAGVRTVRISGQAESAGIPLGSISHLLPADVLDVVGRDPDLARALVFQRARAALGELGDGDRLVLFVDNVDHLDELTTALLGSLLHTETVFAIMTQRTAEGDELAFGELVRSRQVAHLDLEPIDDTDLDVLLYRVLSGPIDLQSLESLTQLSRGRPGALEQLVDNALASGALERHDGVWRLVGPMHSTTDPQAQAPSSLEQLPPPAREAAELLAVAVELELEAAISLVGSEPLDALDRLGMLELTDSAWGSLVSLAHADLGAVLTERLGPLRSRRHKARLIELLGAQPEVRPADAVRMARWSVEIGSPPSRDDVVRALRFAVSAANAVNADVLIDHLTRTAPGADLDYLRAELAFRVGQVDTAFDQLTAIDLDALGPADAASVVRRRSTIMFHVRGRYDEAIDELVARVDDETDDERALAGERLLLTHAIGLMGFLGYADRIDATRDRLPPDLAGPPAHEVTRARAQAAFVRGRYTEALELAEQHRADTSSLDPAVAQPGYEVALSVELSALVVAGRIAEALDVLRAHLPTGTRTMLAWLPLSASRTLLAAGRPRDASAVIMTPLAAVRSQSLMHAEPLMTGALAQSTARLGDPDAARAQLELTERFRPRLVGQMRWTTTRSVADTLLVLGDLDQARAVAAADVDDALGVGATAVAADLLALVARAGGARDVVTRLRDLVPQFDGELWPLQLRHVEALAAGDDGELGTLATEYRRLGYAGLAELAQAALTG